MGGVLEPPALMTLGGRKDRRKVGQVALGSHHPFEGGNLARVCDQVETPKLGHVCECWGGEVAGRAGQGAPAPDVRDAQRGKVWVWPPAEGVASGEPGHLGWDIHVPPEGRPALCPALLPQGSVEGPRRTAASRVPGAGCPPGPLTPAPPPPRPPEGRARSHGHNVCSTWGDFHYKTFDGDVFRFPGLCDYNLASDCRDAYKEFAVHLRRSPGRSGGHPQVDYILLTIKDDAIYLTRQLVVVNGAM